LNIFLTIVSGIIGYLLGSINTSLVVGRLYGVDIRKHGSGNAGMTNVLRTLGRGAAIMVIIGDMLKAVLSCLIGLYITGNTGLMTGGVAAALGHNWPVYFGFKGGKGALTSVTVAIMMDWRIGLIVLGIAVVTTAVTRYMSLGSLLGSISFPILSLIFHKGIEFLIFSLVLSLFVILRHRSNIQRIIKGTESKIGEKKNAFD
jgi:glycerol-3-phosphate acyltransferase PlsY